MADALDIRRQALQRLDALRRAGVTVVPRHRGQAIAVAPPSELNSIHSRQSLPVQLHDPPSTVAPESQRMPRAKPTAAPATTPKTTTTATGTASASSVGRRASTVLTANEIALPPGGDTLDAIRREVAGCTRCRELACTRTQTVFGVGNPHARLCFLGEAPGADEDRKGEPFVGRAGQLLDKIIEACTLRREDVYILNILKCRPPGNRNPDPAEAANCRPFLDRQLALIKPEFICCLGAVAAKNLLASEDSIGKMRGRVFDYHGTKVVCTYHPAYLLRNPSAKADTWQDMQMLMKLMGIKLPQR